jgi:hypothetical protein
LKVNETLYDSHLSPDFVGTHRLYHYKKNMQSSKFTNADGLFKMAAAIQNSLITAYSWPFADQSGPFQNLNNSRLVSH